jgi:hypothetical protein
MTGSSTMRIVVGVVAVFIVVGVAGCGSTGSNAVVTVGSSSTPPATGAGAETTTGTVSPDVSSSGAPAASTPIPSSALTSIDDTSAALTAAGVDCKLVANPPVDAGTSTTLAPPPDVLVRASCVVGPSRIGFTLFADEKNRDMARTQLSSVYGPMMKGFGVLELLWIQPKHGSWEATVGSSGEKLDARPTQNDRDLAKRVAAALAGDVEDITL